MTNENFNPENLDAEKDPLEGQETDNLSTEEKPDAETMAEENLLWQKKQERGVVEKTAAGADGEVRIPREAEG